jgi:hypothetical protein
MRKAQLQADLGPCLYWHWIFWYLGLTIITVVD